MKETSLTKDSNNQTYTEIFPLGEDKTTYRCIDGDFVSLETFDGQKIIKVKTEGLRKLAEEAFYDIAHFLRPDHLKQLAKILDDPHASPNDKFVAFDLLKNANISAGGVLPMCQDTGTATVIAKKGRRIWTDSSDAAALEQGIFNAYRDNNLRYSHLAPLDMFTEQNTKNNLPAQIDIMSAGEDAYHFLFMAKGGGSANKTFLYQATPSLLDKNLLIDFIKEKIKKIGTSACPPYHLAIVIGGLSADMCIKTVKMAAAHYYDTLPTKGSATGHAIRDLKMEDEIFKIAQETGIGAQFGGKYFAHDVRVVRLPRHGASLPIAIGVSCSADRQAKAKITHEGIFLEQMEYNPAQFIPEVTHDHLKDTVVQIDLNQPMSEILNILSQQTVRTRLSLTGPIIVARDAAHKKLLDRLNEGEDLPQYFKDHPIYYAGPAKTPKGYASGSFGPTTAGRMDSFVDKFQSHKGSMVMLAKGNRSPVVRKACQKHGGFYLGSIGGPGARLAQNCIKNIKCIAYEELGMEAIWQIDVVDFPAFVIIDDKGNDFFQNLI